MLTSEIFNPLSEISKKKLLLLTILVAGKIVISWKQTKPWSQSSVLSGSGFRHAEEACAAVD